MVMLVAMMGIALARDPLPRLPVTQVLKPPSARC